MRPLALLLSLACTAFAFSSAHAESPRSMMLELHGGVYSPDIDSEFEGSASPWADTFDRSSILLFKAHWDYQFFQAHGSLAVGGSVGYGWVDGLARNEHGDRTEDEVGFNVLPLQLNLIYRWDWAALNHGVPLVPYVKVGLAATVWWATNANNDISNVSVGGEAQSGSGLAYGWHASAGLMFLLNVFSRSMSADMDNEYGVNHSYIFAEFQHLVLDQFGLEPGLRLSDDLFSFGLAFEF